MSSDQTPFTLLTVSRYEFGGEHDVRSPPDRLSLAVLLLVFCLPAHAADNARGPSRRGRRTRCPFFLNPRGDDAGGMVFALERDIVRTTSCPTGSGVRGPSARRQEAAPDRAPRERGRLPSIQFTNLLSDTPRRTTPGCRGTRYASVHVAGMQVATDQRRRLLRRVNGQQHRRAGRNENVPLARHREGTFLLNSMGAAWGASISDRRRAGDGRPLRGQRRAERLDLAAQPIHP